MFVVIRVLILLPPQVSTSPVFYSTRRQCGLTYAKEQSFVEWRGRTKIGNDCWIGDKAFLVGGITIGDGAVVLAGAVVTKDVHPYAIVGGVPAKVLRYRYDEETIAFLNRIQWWNQSKEYLQNNWNLFNDIDKFKEIVNTK